VLECGNVVGAGRENECSKLSSDKGWVVFGVLFRVPVCLSCDE